MISWPNYSQEFVCGRRGVSDKKRREGWGRSEKRKKRLRGEKILKEHNRNKKTRWETGAIEGKKKTEITLETNVWGKPERKKKEKRCTTIYSQWKENKSEGKEKGRRRKKIQRKNGKFKNNYHLKESVMSKSQG